MPSGVPRWLSMKSPLGAAGMPLSLKAAGFQTADGAAASRALSMCHREDFPEAPYWMLDSSRSRPHRCEIESLGWHIIFPEILECFGQSLPQHGPVDVDCIARKDELVVISLGREHLCHILVS